MSKPVRTEDFQSMLERWGAGRKNESQPAAQEKSDAETLRQAAHALKGASANEGARLMADISQQLQALDEDETVEGAAILIDQLEATFAQVQAEIAVEPGKPI